MGIIESTVTGRVLGISVAVGDALNEGDEVAKVESMKMELPVESEVSGTVTRILVAEGDEVEEGQALVEVSP
ncbi:biotin/lipoyl-containing protein [Paracandidimonas soli]|uniref:Acetyl-CoA carboxylase biotin carboxyl carrier protein n=1 Tax=Paracandidimonas soli TaxID=1917182 RepID=A0A4R3VGJ6_9BURK|nr:biotin/lipoyl-containing protein [Paracandidimonas soli]TCV02874.1 acetyl-CoA carboxylase biotin carboxyl carrier protein [Paracandidimonas soli]